MTTNTQVENQINKLKADIIKKGEKWFEDNSNIPESIKGFIEGQPPIGEKFPLADRMEVLRHGATSIYADIMNSKDVTREKIDSWTVMCRYLRAYDSLSPENQKKAYNIKFDEKEVKIVNKYGAKLTGRPETEVEEAARNSPFPISRMAYIAGSPNFQYNMNEQSEEILHKIQEKNSQLFRAQEQPDKKQYEALIGVKANQIRGKLLSEIKELPLPKADDQLKKALLFMGRAELSNKGINQDKLSKEDKELISLAKQYHHNLDNINYIEKALENTQWYGNDARYAQHKNELIETINKYTQAVAERELNKLKEEKNRGEAELDKARRNLASDSNNPQKQAEFKNIEAAVKQQDEQISKVEKKNLQVKEHIEKMKDDKLDPILYGQQLVGQAKKNEEFILKEARKICGITDIPERNDLNHLTPDQRQEEIRKQIHRIFKSTKDESSNPMFAPLNKQLATLANKLANGGNYNLEHLSEEINKQIKIMLIKAQIRYEGMAENQIEQKYSRLSQGEADTLWAKGATNLSIPEFRESLAKNAGGEKGGAIGWIGRKVEYLEDKFNKLAGFVGKTGRTLGGVGHDMIDHLGGQNSQATDMALSLFMILLMLPSIVVACGPIASVKLAEGAATIYQKLSQQLDDWLTSNPSIAPKIAGQIWGNRLQGEEKKQQEEKQAQNLHKVEADNSSEELARKIEIRYQNIEELSQQLKPISPKLETPESLKITPFPPVPQPIPLEKKNDRQL